MNKEIEVMIQHLKDEIQSNFGDKISYASDCQLLSEQIQKSTSRQISVSTLKRLFGIIKSTSDPSKYTLDTLAVYLQYVDWLEYSAKFEKRKLKSSKRETWENLKEKANIITNASLKSLKNKIGSSFENFPIRRFAETKLENFLYSQKAATAFISVEGNDNSTIVAQLTEKLFIGADAKYTNDIVCLVDGSIFNNLITHYPKITRLADLIEYNPKKGIGTVFRGHPELVKGRLILIIEGIDNIYSDYEKLDHFIDNLLSILLSYEKIWWFKMLITCSPSVWRMFTNRVYNNKTLKSLWFDSKFQGTDDDFINVPQLKRKEIKAILERNHFPQNLDELYFNNPDVFDIINNPSLLHLFLKSYNQYGTIGDVDLLNEYIKKKVLNPPYPNEKFSVVKLFFTLCGYGKYGNEVNKDILNLAPSNIAAYNELIRVGLLYEYSINDNYLGLKTFVKFPNKILFAYYLANILIKENELNTGFLIRIITDYKDSPQLQYDILRYIVKILFKNNKVELLKNIFSIIDKDKVPENLPAYDIPSYVLVNVLVVEMRKNQKIREILVPWYAQSEVGRKLYFERFSDIDCMMLYPGNDLAYLLKYDQSNEAKQYVCFMKFMLHFLAGDEEQCKMEYENSLDLMLTDENKSLNASFHFMTQIIYQSVYEKKVDSHVLKEVYRISGKLLQNGTQNRADSPDFEFTVIFSLNYGKMNKEIIDLANYIFENYDFDKSKPTYLTILFLAVYAKALLEMGEVPKALESYNLVKLKNVYLPVNVKYFVKLRLMLIKTEFLIYKGKLKKARQKLERIKYISQMLKFNYFYNNALDIEKTILEKI